MMHYKILMSVFFPIPFAETFSLNYSIELQKIDCFSEEDADGYADFIKVQCPIIRFGEVFSPLPKIPGKVIIYMCMSIFPTFTNKQQL